MPGVYSKKGKKGKSKKAYRRRKVPYSVRRKYHPRDLSTVVQKVPFVYADRTFVKLRYTRSVSPPAADKYDLVLRGNSVYDPEFTIGGDQPLGFDIYARQYGFYLVHGSKLKVTLMGWNAGNAAACRAVILPAFGYTTYAAQSPEQNREVPYAKYGMCGNYGNKLILKSYMQTSRMYGRPAHAIAADVDYSADVTSNPVNEWYWFIQQATMDGSTLANTTFTVDVTYYVEFYGRRVITDGLENNPAN